jgi:hypothetical protein
VPVVQPSFVRLANRLAPSQAPLHALRNTKPERGVQSVRVEARTALISPRSDSTPLHLSAPGTGAQTATLSLVMEPALKGQVPRRGFASRPSVFPRTPYGPRRLKGPFGSPLIVPTFTHESSASRSRPHRIVSFRRRAILRRFVPHPRKMAKSRRLVLAKASHTLTNRRGRLVPPTAGSAPWVQFPQTRRSARPFQALRKNSVGSSRPRSPAFAGLVLAGRKGHASHRHRSGLKIPARPLSAPASSREYAGSCPLLQWPASPTKERGGRP